MKLDYLNGTEYSIYQEEGMYHCNSDTELLGRFMRIKSKESLLDIGTNNGALLLYGARFNPQSMTGIDLYPEVLQVARKNLDMHHLQAELIETRVQDYKGALFNVIVCNPPYFSTPKKDLVSTNPYIAAARHEEFLSLGDLFSSVRRLLKSNGRFYLVHRSSQINRIMQTAFENGFITRILQIAYETEGGKGKSALFCFQYGNASEMIVKPPVYLDDRDSFDRLEGMV